MRRNPLILLAAFAVLIATAGCGARLTDDQYQQAVGAGAGGGGGGQNAGRNAATTGAGAGSGAATQTTTGAAGGGTGPATGGDAGGAGAGDAGGAGGEAAACAPTAGTAGPGISDGEIKFGNVSTITGAVPDFGITGRAGAKAYFDFINQTEGGVCGRQLTIVNGDDRLDASVNRSVTEQLKDQVFGFVGNTTVVDNGGASVISGTNIPDCSLTVGDQAASMPNNFSPNPINPAANTNSSTGVWSYLKAHYGITKVAIMVPSQNDARARVGGYVADINAAGLSVAGPYEAPITETNYTGYVSKMQADGADALITVLEVNGMAKLAQAVNANPTFKQQLKVPFYGAQAYSQQFIAKAGGAAEGTIIGINYDIVEGSGNPATQSFAEWYARSAPGKDPDFFAVMGWTAAKMCVDALKAAGGAPTRDAAMAYLNGLTDYTADGMLGSRNPVAKTITQQFIIAGVQNGQWVRMYPDSGFATE